MTEKKRPYTKFYHDIEDRLISAKLNGTQWALVMYIQRKTVAWGEEKEKQGECISLTEFSRETGYNRTNIWSELKKLTAAKIIICTQVSKRAFNNPATWTLNHKTDDWKPEVLVNSRTVSDKQTVGKDTTTTVSEKATPTVSELANRIKKEEKIHLKKERESAVADPRFQPLKVFFYEKYLKDRGVALDASGSAYAALKDLLKRQPDWSLEYLKGNASRYIRSKDQWHRGQGNPLRFWASNTNAFIPGQDSGRGYIGEGWDPLIYYPTPTPPLVQDDDLSSNHG